MKRDFLSLAAYERNELEKIINLASRLKARREEATEKLRGKTLGMLFQKPSTRTRVSFEVAMNQLDGRAIYLGWNDLQLGRGETIADTAKALSRYVDAIVARVNRHEDIEELARNASVPVINGLSDRFHPCQALADLLTIEEKMGRLEDVKVAFVGDATNVCNSLMIGCAKMGTHISVAGPKEYQPKKDIVDIAIKSAKNSGSQIIVTSDPFRAVKGADIIYTDTFVSMGLETEKKKRLSAFIPKYQVTKKLLESTGKKTYFMHCLPAHRGGEVTAEVIDGKSSIVWDQAENRLHTQKALLIYLLL